MKTNFLVKDIMHGNIWNKIEKDSQMKFLNNLSDEINTSLINSNLKFNQNTGCFEEDMRAILFSNVLAFSGTIMKFIKQHKSLENIKEKDLTLCMMKNLSFLGSPEMLRNSFPMFMDSKTSHYAHKHYGHYGLLEEDVDFVVDLFINCLVAAFCIKAKRSVDNYETRKKLINEASEYANIFNNRKLIDFTQEIIDSNYLQL